MAEYTDEEADRLIKLHGLPEQSKAKWKFRGRIPDELYEPDYTPKPKANRKIESNSSEKIKQDRLQIVFSNPKWYIKKMAELAGLSEAVCEPFSAGKTWSSI